MKYLHSRHGVTLTDLLIATVMIGLLMLGFMPMLADKAKEGDNRIKCMSNLRTIGQAMFMYSNEDVRSGAFPRTLYDKEKTASPKFYTRPDSDNPFIGPETNDVTAAMFLLLRSQDITPDFFICPSSGATAFKPEKGKTIQAYGNFKSQENLTYSLHNPYLSKEAIKNGAKYNNSLQADFAIMADMNPGGDAVLTVTAASKPEELRNANSSNHGGDGQNVLYADGHVEWSETPFCGVKRDNIYTFEPLKGADGKEVAGGIIGSPTGGTDTLLLPVWDPKVKAPEVTSIPNWNEELRRRLQEAGQKRVAEEMERVRLLQSTQPATQPGLRP